MKALVETIAKALVDHPNEVRVNAVDKERILVYELSVHPEDMGKIIGKQGRIAKALRNVVIAASVQTDKRVTVEIV
ncbi:KH domain-containing protein [Brevibacillus composti]|uniref:RNA-binding protein KhpA n=1 Tax=Brevibacillus composti TaxID=2796470 RepID=A0A7T5JQZ8_9BACL|nr:KH domain-containing protein [Brevibacillus composti]QQE76561.1 KH domain-containing protein [Brevibacillus composti]QUO43120.1 KH domain-containing protein [Brevibacillus composti]